MDEGLTLLTLMIGGTSEMVSINRDSSGTFATVDLNLVNGSTWRKYIYYFYYGQKQTLEELEDPGGRVTAEGG